MGDETNNMVKVAIWILSSLCYCYFVCSKIPKGKSRLISLLPVVILFAFVPLLLSYMFPITIVTAFTWLANFKLLLYAFDQGPLSCHPSMSLLRFIPMAILPLKEVEPRRDHPSPKLPLNWPTKVLLFAFIVGASELLGTSWSHPSLVITKNCSVAYLVVDMVFGACSYMVRAVSNMELLPPSDEPYLATSLRDFWGRRWNLAVTDALRNTVYKPVRSLLEGPLGRWAPLPAVLAAFLVSGLMHELLFYYLTRVAPTWEVTLFFLLHGACVAVEFGLEGWAGGRLRSYRVVSTLLTVGFVMGTATWLFFPPLARSGATDRFTEESITMLNFVKRIVNFGRC